MSETWERGTWIVQPAMASWCPYERHCWSAWVVSQRCFDMIHGGKKHEERYCAHCGCTEIRVEVEKPKP